MALAPETEKMFNLERVHDSFLASLTRSEDILLTEYLEGYRELNQFFHLMGAVFSFVSSDIEQKINILEERLNGYTEKADSTTVEEQLNVRSVEEMMLHEKANGLITKKSFISSSRTLLRLHRGLDFIRVFLKDVGALQNSERTSSVCQKAYNDTLAQYHPWIVRTGATMAMYTMPTKEQLFFKVCGTDANIDNTLSVLPRMLKVTNEVYNRTQMLYEKHEITNLD